MVQQLNSDDQIQIIPEELHNFFMHFQDAPNKEKLVFGIGNGKHFTVQFGIQSKVLDVHYTDETFPDGDERCWRTLVRIAYDQLEELLPQIEEIVVRVLYPFFASCRINLGKLHHHNCYLVQMDNTEKKLEGLIVTKKKKIRFGKSVSRKKLLSLYLEPQDMPAVRPSNLYQVYKLKNGHHHMQGIIWYHPEMKGRKPFYVTGKQFNRMAAAIRTEVYNKCKELGIFMDTELWDEIKG